MFTDTPKYQAWRRTMVENLRKEGISDKRILSAMEKLPRHWFCRETLLDNLLYDINAALVIDCNQTISKPLTVAWQTQLLDLKPLQTVFEIGTGSGYQTAILCELGARVYTMERQRPLFLQTKKLLADLGYQARCFWGDSFNGITEMKGFRYDRILVTCGAERFPDTLMAQLKVGGVMVVPVGEGEQKMIRVVKEGEEPSQWKKEVVGDARFVPMLEGKSNGHDAAPIC